MKETLHSNTRFIQDSRLLAPNTTVYGPSDKVKSLTCMRRNTFPNRQLTTQLLASEQHECSTFVYRSWSSMRSSLMHTKTVMFCFQKINTNYPFYWISHCPSWSTGLKLCRIIPCPFQVIFAFSSVLIRCCRNTRGAFKLIFTLCQHLKLPFLLT